MLLFRSDPFGGTHELLPCGLLGGDLVELFRKNKSKYYWYDFTVRGERYRGSTKETNETRAQKAAALKLAATIKGSDPLDRKPPTLREYSKDFLQWVETGRLEADSRRYYRNGWRLLEQTKIAGMRMDQITKDEVEKLKFPGSASNGNNALRTLRRMYSKAKEDKLIFEVPDFALFKEHGRSLRLNDEAERRLSAVADQPLKDIIVVMRDTGMRNARELYCMRVENVDFDAGTIFTPDSKTESGRRFIPLRGCQAKKTLLLPRMGKLFGLHPARCLRPGVTRAAAVISRRFHVSDGGSMPSAHEAARAEVLAPDNVPAMILCETRGL